MTQTLMPSTPPKRRRWLWIPIAFGVLGVAACIGGGIAFLAAPNPAPSAPAAQPNSEICRFTADGGSYYLLVTSATDHNFKACDGGAQYDGNVDKLLADGTGIDRRCILGDAATARLDAIVGVYSSPAAADMAAATAFCNANGVA